LAKDINIDHPELRHYLVHYRALKEKKAHIPEKDKENASRKWVLEYALRGVRHSVDMVNDTNNDTYIET
jgi:hypothetical protein